MIGSEVKRMESLKKTIGVAGNICMVLQIIVLLVVFACTLYIIFGILENHSLDFLTPYMEAIKSFVISVFGSSIKESQDGIDGRLVLFILAGLLLTFFIVQLRLACNTYSKIVDKKIVAAREKEEADFNKQLEKDMHTDIIKQSHYLLAVQIRAKSLFKDTLTNEVHSLDEIVASKNDAITKFVAHMKQIRGIAFSKDGEIILISSSDINTLDDVVTEIWYIANALKAEYRTKKIGIRTKVAVDSYNPSKSIKNVYKSIRPLLDLNANNEVLCFGNFRNRYNLLENTQYMICIKGQYELGENGDETVWSLVKKD